MNKLVSLCLLGSLAMVLSGCAGFAFLPRQPAMGFLYSDTANNEVITENTVGTKSGEGCETSILGWVTTGDASVQTIAAKAGITKVASVDHKHTNILGIYAKYCGVVTGE